MTAAAPMWCDLYLQRALDLGVRAALGDDTARTALAVMAAEHGDRRLWDAIGADGCGRRDGLGVAA